MTGVWRGTVRAVLLDWYQAKPGVLAPGYTAQQVADNLIASIVAEVEAEATADLRAQLDRANRAIANLREQHELRTEAEIDRRDHALGYPSQLDAARAREAANLQRAWLAEASTRAWVARCFDAERRLAETQIHGPKAADTTPGSSGE